MWYIMSNISSLALSSREKYIFLAKLPSEPYLCKHDIVLNVNTWHANWVLCFGGFLGSCLLSFSVAVNSSFTLRVCLRPVVFCLTFLGPISLMFSTASHQPLCLCVVLSFSSSLLLLTKGCCLILSVPALSVTQFWLLVLSVWRFDKLRPAESEF